MQNIIRAVDKYWCAANYLTVAFMYLNRNIFLSRELIEGDLKIHPSGHWGTSPGINFIYAHINRYICDTDRKIQLVIGPGHGGNALLSNLILEGTLKEYYSIQSEDKISYFNHELVNELITNIRTEVNPFLPGTIYDGGELGYSLPVAFGTVLDAPDSLAICIIGDGEFETGTISSSWRCKDYFNRSSGFVLPILHLNGYRMGNHSLLSLKNDHEIISFFEAMGYSTKIVNSNHKDMIEALNWTNQMYKEIELGKHDIWPILVLRSPKGWTAPNMGLFQVEDTLHAHKNPLKNLNLQESVKYLEYWLKSYRPNDLFDENGFPDKEIVKIIPKAELRLGRALCRYVRKGIDFPETVNYLPKIEADTKYPNVMIVESYLSNIIQRNSDNFRIMSPDELQSNLLGKLLSVPIANNELFTNENCRVLEILNENICQALMQGYTLSGRNCIMISYEAFMPIISSMVSQFAKWLFQAKKVPWRKKTSSITYLLTSLWESNTYSHQNPEFINILLGHEHDFIRIYLPVDANSLLACMGRCLSSENQINAIIASKQNMPQWLDFDAARLSVDKGAVAWEWLDPGHNSEPDIVIAAAGDYPVRECIASIRIINEYLPDIKVRFVSVVELTSIGSKSVYPHAMSQDEFYSLFSDQLPIIFCFHGYSSAIKMLLHDRLESNRCTVLGYKNQSIISTNDLNKMILNENSRYHIVLEVCRLLKNNISDRCYQKSQMEMNNQIQERLWGLQYD